MIAHIHPEGSTWTRSTCPACRRNDDVWEMTCGAFGVVGVLTVAPVVPLLIFAMQSAWGAVGGWFGLGFFYVGVPLLTGAVVYAINERKQR